MCDISTVEQKEALSHNNNLKYFVIANYISLPQTRIAKKICFKFFYFHNC